MDESWGPRRLQYFQPIATTAQNLVGFSLGLCWELELHVIKTLTIYPIRLTHGHPFPRRCCLPRKNLKPHATQEDLEPSIKEAQTPVL